MLPGCELKEKIVMRPLDFQEPLDERTTLRSQDFSEQHELY